MIIGPSLGGLLANPTKTYPDLFGGIQFLENNPYFLPCACSSLFSVVGLVVGYFFLPETNQAFLHNRALQEEVQPLLIAGSDIAQNFDEQEIILDGNLERPLLDTTDTLAEIPQTSDDIGRNAKQSIFAYSLLAFMGIIAFEIIPLWTVSKPPVGFSWTAQDLGLCLSAIGAVSFLCQIIVYPTISRKYDAIQLYKYPMFVYPIFFVLMPLVSNYYGNDRIFSFIIMGMVMGVKAIIDNVVVTSVMILVFYIHRLIILPRQDN